MIVVLVAIGVAAVLVLFYGAVRPDGDPDDAHDGVEGGLGWLVPRTTLDFDDVAAAPCAQEDIRGFAVAPGASCDMALPDLSRIALCVEGPASAVVVSTKGDEYPRQSFEASDMPCTAPETVTIYDTGTTLTIRCIGFAPCTVLVAAPAG
jgi:hypothetical protein